MSFHNLFYCLLLIYKDEERKILFDDPIQYLILRFLYFWFYLLNNQLLSRLFYRQTGSSHWVRQTRPDSRIVFQESESMAKTGNGKKRLPSQENLLLDYVRRLEKHKAGRKVVHLHLSELRPFNRRDQHIRIAARNFEPLIADMSGQLFILKNSDLFFIYKGDAQEQTEAIVQEIRFLFDDDPLVAEVASQPHPFASWQDADADYENILCMVQSFVDAEEKRQITVRARMDARSAIRTKQKQSDPLTPEVLARVETVLERADVFVQNLAPGAAGRLGLNAGTLRERRPQLIVCDVSGYGSTGPYRDKKAYDLLVQAEAGLVSITGTETEPVKSSISVADIAAGMYAYSGVLTALFRRERTGDGATIEVSMLEALTEWMGFPFYYTMYGGSPPPRSGAHHAAIAPYGPFTGADGETVFLGLQNEMENEMKWGREDFIGGKHFHWR